MADDRLVVFDLDGTLVDTAPDLLTSLNHVLATEGYQPASREQISFLLGQGARKMLERGLELNNISLPDTELDRLFQDFLTYYGSHIADHSRPFPGVINAMDWLRENGCRFAVCTNKLESLSRTLLNNLQLADYFETVAGRDTFPVCKPNPDHLFGTIKAAGGNPQRSVLIGDSKTDIATAKAAGIPVVAVTFGYTDIPVTELGPDSIIDHFDQLIEAVDQVLPPL
ncbi:phosphoglycolate phosphatase [Coralliovum pocilloporae]|uniref:phosphoglycolate phosphatase n=1 Tax=Coralliovum pocilloporae TaxID=3066369 RepID=UPI003306C9D1